ncbi:cysteine dioxygenase type 1-like isoform X2 [Liolophura sinensis]|uniref:cysteine dioxygenase type 1-like isoform X2 n=1 Tax=Liolophura sinensis TaxID=3198878 RepID=UPI0031586170
MQGSEQPASSAMQSLSLSDKTEREKHRESPNSLNELIKELHVIFSSDRVDVDYVKHLMSEFKSVKKEWKKFAKFDPHRYTRNLVDSGNGKFNLMILCWNESQGSSIHSHANSHCFLKVMQGSVKEEMYDWPENSERVAEIEEEVGLKMIPRETMIHESEAVTYINALAFTAWRTRVTQSRPSLSTCTLHHSTHVTRLTREPGAGDPPRSHSTA